MEMNVALNKVGDSDFQLGIEEVLMKPSRTPRLAGRPNPGFLQQVSEDQVNSYFQDNKLTKQIDLDIVENSLLPTRHFFEKFSDSVRVWINESSTPQPEVRDAIELEVKEVLRAEGIDLRDKTVTVPMARDYLNRKNMMARKNDEMTRRASQLISDKKLRSWYFHSINNELNKLTEDRKAFHQRVNSNIQQIFESAYLERLSNIYEKSKNAQSLEKRRMFIRLKKFLIKSRVLGYRSQEVDRMTEQINALPFKQIHMTEDWETSFRDIEHPELSKSVMWHLSKVVGKAVFAPPAMAKTFLTNPEAAKSLQGYSFDKIELEKLRKDLLENPKKYEEMLTQEALDDGFLAGRDPGSWSKAFLERSERREYWYRLYNDGYCDSLDNWPKRAEYFTYKHWADGIKNKTLDTLKYTVNRLLLDFQNDQDVGNTVVDSNQVERQSRRATMENIMQLLNERESGKDDSSLSNDSKSKRSLQVKKKTSAQIQKDFQRLIEQDEKLSSLFKTAGNAEGNSLMKEFRAELLNELLQLVEVVLLRKKDEMGLHQIDQEVFEKRLGAIMSPQNSSKDQTSQLSFIDSFLQDKHGEQVLTEAISIVQPFFIQICREKLDQEAAKVLQGFDQDVTQEHVLEFYAFNLANPNVFKESNVMQKLRNPYQDEQSRDNFAQRSVYNSLGAAIDADIDPSLPLEERENAITQNAKEIQISLAHFQKLQGLAQKTKQEEYFNMREKELQVPFEEDRANDYEEMSRATSSFTQEDVDNLEVLGKSLLETKDYLAKHEYELRTVLDNIDYLEIYSKSINDFNLSMDHLFRQASHPDYYAESIERGFMPIDQMRKQLGVNKDYTWEQLGEYAKYLKGFYDYTNTIAQQTDYFQDHEKMVDFMVSSDQRQMETANISRESIFRAISEAKSDHMSTQTREDSIRSDIQSISSLQKRIMSHSQEGLRCLELAQFAPQEIKNDVKSIVSSNSKFVDHKALMRYLTKRDWKKPPEARDYIDKSKLMKEVVNGTVLKDFIQQHKDSKVDVVSLSEIKSVVKAAQSQGNDNELVDQIQMILDHIDEQMVYISHDRRQSITLGDFISKHHYLNASSFRNYSSDLLKNQIENALGKKEVDEDQSQVKEDFGARSDETADQAYEQAKKCTMINPQMHALKNMYENKLLQEYTSAEYDVEKVESLIEAYTYARLKQCQLNTDFAKAMKSPHANIYLKTLRQRVLEELRMDDNTELSEFRWTSLPEVGMEEGQVYDIEARYNAHHLNNENSIGYNNLEELAAGNKSAHENVFDKMLAQFFLQKRSEYKSGNKLQEDLEAFFDEQMEKKNLHSQQQQESGHPGETVSENNKLGFHYLSQTIKKDDQLALIPQNFPAMLDLDITVNRRLNNNKSGLSEEMRHLESDHCIIPDYFDYNDVRKPADVYVKDKLMQIMVDLFSSRRSLEKYLSRRELIAYDQVMTKYLEYDKLTSKLKREVYKDYNELEQMNQVHNHNRDNERSQEKQFRKTRNMQAQFNSDVVNEDAFYKLMAYTGLLEKKRKENHKETMADEVLESGAHSFENFYQDELFADAKRPAREIDEEVFKAKKFNDQMGGSDRLSKGFLDLNDRRDLWLEEHKMYKENKLEQQQRIETFYLLEQFFQNQKQSSGNSQDKDLLQAQAHIQDYFKDPENTYFFDKNKIQ